MFVEILTSYLQQSDIYRDLVKHQKLGWKSTEGDSHFRERRALSRNAGSNTKKLLFNMMFKVAKGLFGQGGPMYQKIPTDAIILDMGMAPGGFSVFILQNYRPRHVHALTLKESSGGYRVLSRNHTKLSVDYGDVTSYLDEVDPALRTDTEVAEVKVAPTWPYGDTRFDLVICGAQAQYKEDDTVTGAGNPFLCVRYAQMYVALQKLQPGGSFVMILGEATSPYTMAFVHLVSQFAEVGMFKPHKAFKEKGIFYLVATNVRTESDEAKQMGERLGRAWLAKGNGHGLFESGTDEILRDEHEEAIVASFGNEYLQMTRPVWATQLNALKRASWIDSAR